MSPTSFTLVVSAAAERFAQQLAKRLAKRHERDDIREMRAALDEDAVPLEVYVAATRHRDRSHAHAG